MHSGPAAPSCFSPSTAAPSAGGHLGADLLALVASRSSSVQIYERITGDRIDILHNRIIVAPADIHDECKKLSCKWGLLSVPIQDPAAVLHWTAPPGSRFKRNMIREATAFLLDVLKRNLPEHVFLQTKVLGINLVTYPNIADAILANGMFGHYDRPRIAQLCEKAGLYLRALQHYSELPDIKRVIVNTHAIELQALAEFFGTLSREWALECMKDLLLVNLRGNLQIVVQAAKEYSEQLGVLF